MNMYQSLALSTTANPSNLSMFDLEKSMRNPNNRVRAIETIIWFIEFGIECVPIQSIRMDDKKCHLMKWALLFFGEEVGGRGSIDWSRHVHNLVHFDKHA